VRLEGIKKTFKGMELLRDINWEVKKGERVGLVGVNGAGKTTQLQIITGKLEADGGVVLKAKPNMKIAYLTQVRASCRTSLVASQTCSAPSTCGAQPLDESIQLALASRFLVATLCCGRAGV